MITDEFRRNTMLKHTNQRAGVEGARGSIYVDWRPFSIYEINSSIGHLIANGICPKPNARLWFINDSESKIFSNNNLKRGLKVVKEDSKRKRCTPTYYSHVEFLEKLALHLI